MLVAGLLLWSQTREQWVGEKKKTSNGLQLREPKLRLADSWLITNYMTVFTLYIHSYATIANFPMTPPPQKKEKNFSGRLIETLASKRLTIHQNLWSAKYLNTPFD